MDCTADNNAPKDQQELITREPVRLLQNVIKMLFDRVAPFLVDMSGHLRQ
jgi:hypothetical protein